MTPQRPFLNQLAAQEVRYFSFQGVRLRSQRPSCYACPRNHSYHIMYFTKSRERKNKITHTTESSSVICSNCGTKLPNHEQIQNSYPSCGHTERTFIKNVQETIHISDKAVRIKEFYETNPRIHTLVIALTILGPVLGLYFQGIFGFAIGIYLGIAIYLLGPDAVTKVREITGG